MSILHNRSPGIYRQNQCILCQDKSIETISHLAKCTKLHHQWELAEIQISTEIKKWVIKEFKDNDESIDLNLLMTVLFPKFSGLKKQEKIDIQRYNRWKGFLNSSCKTVIMEAFSLSETKTTKLLTKFLCISWIAIHDLVWKSRCEKVIEWEHSRDITSQKKAKSYIGRKKEDRKNILLENSSMSNNFSTSNNSFTSIKKRDQKIKDKESKDEWKQHIADKVKMNTLSKLKSNVVQHWSQWKKKFTWKGNT